MNFTELISSTIATTFLIGILGFILRHWIAERIKRSIKHEYDKELATHKADLKRDYDVKIESLKAEFAKNQFRFSHIFKRQADTIIKTYEELLDLKDAVHTSINLAGRSDDYSVNKLLELDTKRRDFYKYFLKNKIYLPTGTAGKIATLLDKLNDIQNTYQNGLQLSRINRKQGYDTTMRAVDSLFGEAPKLLEDLENDFRKLLGLLP